MAQNPNQPFPADNMQERTAKVTCYQWGYLVGAYPPAFPYPLLVRGPPGRFNGTLPTLAEVQEKLKLFDASHPFLRIQDDTSPHPSSYARPPVFDTSDESSLVEWSVPLPPRSPSATLPQVLTMSTTALLHSPSPYADPPARPPSPTLPPLSWSARSSPSTTAPAPALPLQSLLERPSHSVTTRIPWSPRIHSMSPMSTSPTSPQPLTLHPPLPSTTPQASTSSREPPHGTSLPSSVSTQLPAPETSSLMFIAYDPMNPEPQIKKQRRKRSEMNTNRTHTNIAKKPRVMVKVACSRCAEAGKKCENARPCSRCVDRGFGASCSDRVRKVREKGNKRAPHRENMVPTLGMEEMRTESQLLNTVGNGSASSSKQKPDSPSDTGGSVQPAAEHAYGRYSEQVQINNEVNTGPSAESSVKKTGTLPPRQRHGHWKLTSAEASRSR
ncbi:hypothetical protein PENSPDRAFT_655816 [Peniophora sp. CONT]|nr:hypothetical protein PENSPDRAFT_655816 [Peniophora sp. CONT]